MIDKHIRHRKAAIAVITILLAAAGCSSISVRWERHAKLKCQSCHTDNPTTSRPALKNNANPSDRCRECHKYHNDGDHHPSSTEELIGEKCSEVDPSFPLFDGKMECLTCHEMHANKSDFSGNPYFLRGGPYKERRDVCLKCHKDEFEKRFNPHESMLMDGRIINHGTCLFCHAVPPDPDVDRQADVTFRAAPAFLCWRCHPPMNQTFMTNHFLKRPSHKTFQEMLRGQVRHQLILPLDSRGRLTCSTCHNPHQPGVMKYELAKKGEGAKKRLRNSDMCSVCHSGKVE